MSNFLKALEAFFTPYIAEYSITSYWIAALIVLCCSILIPKYQRTQASTMLPSTNLIFGIVLLVSFCPFLLLSAYVHPQAEDIAISQRVIEYGILGYNYDLYATFDGRYFVNALYSVNPLVFKAFWAYKLLPFLLLGIFVASTFSFIRSFSKNIFAKSTCLIAAISLCCLYAFEIPNLWNSFYYMASSYVYMLPLILTLLLFGFIVRLSYANSNSYRLLLTLLSYLLIIAIIGSNEMFIIAIPGLISVVTVVCFVRGSQQKWLMASFVLVSIAATVVNVSAPGLLQSFEDHPIEKDFDHLLFALKTSTYYTWVSLSKWTLHNPLLFLVSILFLPGALKLCDKNEVCCYHFYIPPFLSLSIFAIGLVLLSFPFYWAVGTLNEDYPQRIFNVVYFFFLAGWFMNIQIIVGNLRKRLPGLRSWLAFIPRKSISVFMLICCLLFSQNLHLAAYDLLSGEALAYHRAMKDRFNRLIETSRQEGADTTTVYFNHLKHKPKSIYTGIAIDPNRAQPGWNQSFENYFNIWEVRYPDDTISKKEYQKEVRKGDVTD